MTPAHDERMNIGAKGMSGEGYKGHTFWDTEIFMLPYFSFTHPEIAKSLVTYRYLGLDGAHKKAASNGYEGAQYPWEAAWPTDGEVTPVWGAADIVTGQETKIWSGFIEQHAAPHCQVILVDPGRGHHACFSKKMVSLGYSHRQHKPEHTDYLTLPFKGQVLRYQRQH